MEDVARAVEMRRNRLQEELDGLVAALGLVEMDIEVGEEPEEGVEFEVVGVSGMDVNRDLERRDPLCDETRCEFHHDPSDPACVRAKHRRRK